MFIKKGDWVKYRSSEGFCVEKKILEIKPNDELVVGQHDNDPKPDVIARSSVIKKL